MLTIKLLAVIVVSVGRFFRISTQGRILMTKILLVLIFTIVIFTSCSEREPRPNFRGFVTDFKLLEYGVMVMEAHDGRLWGVRYTEGTRSIQPNFHILVSSSDHGYTWNEVYRFVNPIETMHLDNFGNIFVATSLDRWGSEGTAELFRSSDYGNSFRIVLDIISGSPYHWSIASADGLMFLSEYGYKGYDNARRIYRSWDFGKTWEIVYEPEEMYNYHNHKTVIAGNVVYQSVGDWPNNKILRSLDFGDTWEMAVEGIHPTGAVVFDEHILWGLDSARPYSGVAWYNRLTGEIESVWHPPYPFGGSSYDIGIANGIVYVTFLSYTGIEDHPGSIFFSKNEGQTWELLGYIQKYVHEGVGLFQLTFDCTFGYIDILAPFEDYGKERMSRFRGTLRFRLINASMSTY